MEGIVEKKVDRRQKKEKMREWCDLRVENGVAEVIAGMGVATGKLVWDADAVS